MSSPQKILLIVFHLIILLNNFNVFSQQTNDEESDELLDVKTEFHFSSLESLSSLSSRLTMTSEELNNEIDNSEEEEEEDFSHKKGMLDESRRWPKDLEGFVIIPYEFYKRSKYSELSIFYDVRKHFFSLSIFYGVNIFSINNGIHFRQQPQKIDKNLYANHRETHLYQIHET